MITNVGHRGYGAIRNPVSTIFVKSFAQCGGSNCRTQIIKKGGGMAPIAKRETGVTLNYFYSTDLGRGGDAKR